MTSKLEVKCRLLHDSNNGLISSSHPICQKSLILGSNDQISVCLSSNCLHYWVLEDFKNTALRMQMNSSKWQQLRPVDDRQDFTYGPEDCKKWLSAPSPQTKGFIAMSTGDDPLLEFLDHTVIRSERVTFTLFMKTEILYFGIKSDLFLKSEQACLRGKWMN